jgi:hypothetical protein
MVVFLPGTGVEPLVPQNFIFIQNYPTFAVQKFLSPFIFESFIEMAESMEYAKRMKGLWQST